MKRDSQYRRDSHALNNYWRALSERYKLWRVSPLITQCKHRSIGPLSASRGEKRFPHDVRALFLGATVQADKKVGIRGLNEPFHRNKELLQGAQGRYRGTR